MKNPVNRFTDWLLASDWPKIFALIVLTIIIWHQAVMLAGRWVVRERIPTVMLAPDKTTKPPTAESPAATSPNAPPAAAATALPAAEPPLAADDWQKVRDAWPTLSAAVKQEILAKIAAAGAGK